ncbi:hypothetical protein TCAL_06106 [Tigriopus californicus]|uniref:J domain-containing protein n=1 Tax=Tigriopus californicus TaxID=6832 RepID=A0A553P2D0_TIGCA|nr:dnaJ homolog subfamily C member 12-like [Tigriopus californicus]TRY71839.1 hypothetical protein TCAL_06106 [Tigriopus californicus]|eukprot:TCALIF_06106-PA protein Name:"Similar to jdp J domain-containing protein (Manduca sexta)" AED:0.00 eAED:0.00 QI:855/1/1/1/1/1/2/510/302
MNVDSILNYERDPSEDFYKLLGCDRSSTQEQIITEFKTRAKKCHPDKARINNPNDPDALNEEKLPGKTDEFQLLHQAKSVLTNPEERRKYDKWLDSGLSMSYKQWKGMRESVHTSMHWATPKTTGRMLEDPALREDQDEEEEEEIDIELKGKSSITEDEDGDPSEMPSLPRSVSKPPLKRTLAKATSVDGEPDDEVYYSPTDVNAMGLKVNPPPKDWGWDDPGWFEKNLKNALPKPPVSVSANQTSGNGTTPKTIRGVTERLLEDRRQQFADGRQDSSVSSVVIMGRVSDMEMRRKFRNFEI